MTIINHHNDGINHINIYSKGKTQLGQFLSNFCQSPIDTEDGHFESIEGYWYWLKCHNDHLRNLYGYEAKQFGKHQTGNKMDENEFRTKIRNACWLKLVSNMPMMKLFINSKLPFTHYYVYNNTMFDGGGKWLIDMWEEYRKHLVNHADKNIQHLNILEVPSGTIVDQRNCMGKMGAGIALSIRRKWPAVYKTYMNYYRAGALVLGNTVPHTISAGLMSIGICGQYYYGRDKRYTDYDAVRLALKRIISETGYIAPIYFPYKIGCTNAGGDWETMQMIIYEHFPNVIICDPTPQPPKVLSTEALVIRTAQMNIAKKQPDFMDITIKSSKGLGTFFAPTWDIVKGVKSGRLSNDKYTKIYYELIKERITNNKHILDEILSLKSVTLGCYCRKGDFCHRHLVVEILTYYGAKYIGEI